MESLLSPQTLAADLWQKMGDFEYIPGKTLLADWRIPIGAAAVYLVTVFTLQKIMARVEKPFTLVGATVVHNIILCLWSLAMWVGILVELASLGMKMKWGNLEEVLFCDADHAVVNKGRLYFWVYVFYISKFYELLDTVLLVLKKKELIFLHVYHHAITMILVWVCLESKMPVQWSCELLNSGIHILMYYYYAASAAKIQVWWKKYITTFQIIQFILTIFVQVYSMYYAYFISPRPCPSFDTYANEFGMFVIISFLLLFIDFYRKTYKKKTV
uniref:Elongation of fatty acids protein n=1 Tax=Palpitomonas bilix TaxID=652834 RepID=A0A7S3DFA5_9EUKA|mmetsp:Transcript_34433/g.89127  ORF Transcript_34433/g.89127 Transcript_34433/m.89127 type:complete len:272 (+) Transcript_34433:75-890(+)